MSNIQEQFYLRHSKNMLKRTIQHKTNSSLCLPLKRQSLDFSININNIVQDSTAIKQSLGEFKVIPRHSSFISGIKENVNYSLTKFPDQNYGFGYLKNSKKRSIFKVNTQNQKNIFQNEQINIKQQLTTECSQVVQFSTNKYENYRNRLQCDIFLSKTKQIICFSPENFKKIRSSLQRKSSLPILSPEQIKSSQKGIYQQCCIKFNNKLILYRQLIQKNCQFYGMQFQRIRSYPKNLLAYSVIQTKSQKFVRKILKSRWWLNDKKNGTFEQVDNFVWADNSCETFFEDKLAAEKQQDYGIITQQTHNLYQGCEEQEKSKWLQIKNKKIHNHFDMNDLMKYYVLQGFADNKERQRNKMVPIFFIVKVGDTQWKNFKSIYYDDISLVQIIQDEQVSFSSQFWVIKVKNNKGSEDYCLFQNRIDKIQKLILQKLKQGNYTFIIQKQCESFKLLKREITINCFMLVTRLKGSIKAFFFKDGLIQLNDEHAVGVYIAKQKRRNNFSRFKQLQQTAIQLQDIIDFKVFNNKVKQIHGDKYNFQQVKSKMRQISGKTIRKCFTNIKSRRNLPCFQIFQLQFNLNTQFQPCLSNIISSIQFQKYQESLPELISTLIDHSFKLSIDVIFPPPLQWPNGKKHLLLSDSHQNDYQLIFDQATPYKKY